MPSAEETINENLNRLFAVVSSLERQAEKHKIENNLILNRMTAMSAALEVATIKLNMIAMNGGNVVENRVIARKTIEDIGAIFDAEKEREQREQTKQ